MAEKGLPGFTSAFTHLLAHVRWVERGGRVTTFDAVSLAHEATEAGCQTSPSYIRELANGRKRNPSAHLVAVLGDVFADAAQTPIGPRYFFEAEWRRRVDSNLAKRNALMNQKMSSRLRGARSSQR